MPNQLSPLPTSDPEALGFSVTRLDRIRTALQAQIAGNKLPGAVLAIARHGQLAFFGSFRLPRQAGRDPHVNGCDIQHRLNDQAHGERRGAHAVRTGTSDGERAGAHLPAAARQHVGRPRL